MTLRSAESGGLRGWIPLDTYLTVHARHLQAFITEEFIQEDGLALREPSADKIVIKGRLRCQNGLFIDVETTLAVRVVRGRRRVRTVRYKYHAGITGSRARTIFRYDNSHSYVREGHPDPHHKHLYDHRTWQEATPPEWIGADRRPHLSDVIEELRQWWETIGQYLALGNGDDSVPRR